jgi:fatty acid desaturase
MATTTLTQRVSTSIPVPNKKPQVVDPSRLRLRIDDRWYDITQWKSQHPGGVEILEYLNGKDATDTFYSLHSREAIDRLKRMSSTPVSVDDDVVIPELQSFRKWRNQLIDDGWFKRSLPWDLFYFSSIFIFAAIAAFFSLSSLHSSPILSILFLSLSMQQAGWVSHDFVHGRCSYSNFFGVCAGNLINAFSTRWWSNKHNTHHCYTNHVGIDSDIENDPVFHLFFPSEKNDVYFRKYQHLYFLPVASSIFVSWRIQSLIYVYTHRQYSELFFMMMNYVFLYSCFSWYVSIPSMFIAGFLVATIVTASHQSEEMFEKQDVYDEKKQYNFVRTQFESTRDAVTSNFFFEYLWGGMQYQLEHHLFPTMPKYYYRRMVPLVMKWASENNLPYKSESDWQILVRNFNTLKYYAQPLNQ